MRGPSHSSFVQHKIEACVGWHCDNDVLLVGESCQFLLAIFAFGEHFGPAHYVTFACIWVALAIFTLAPRLRR